MSPGVTRESAFVFGRRYFSGLTHDGRGSTGARWITSVTETLVPQTTTDGKRALQHVSWLQPYNDPALWYVEDSTGSNTFTAPVSVGGKILKTGTSYALTFKSGAVHTFATSSSDVIRIAERKDPWGNATTFVYEEQASQYGGYSVADPLEPASGHLYITDSRGVTYTITYDALGYITSLADPLGSIWQFTYAMVGATSYLARVTYPSRSVMEPDNAIVTRTVKREYTYNADHRLHQVFDDYGNAVLTNTYFASHPAEIQTQTDATGGVYTFSHPASMITEVIDPNGWKTGYTHNSLRQVLELRQYVANFSGGSARTTNTATCYTWLFERNAYCNCGPITKITEPDGGIIRMTYSTPLNLTEVRKESADGSQQLKWTWTFDAQHRVTSFVPPEGNAATNPAPYTITLSRTTSGTNLVTTRTIPARDWRTSASIWTETSDSRGRMVEMTGPSHDDTVPSFQGKWTYSTSGAGIHLPLAAYVRDSSTIAYTYQWDAAARMTGITDDAGFQWTCTYDPEGRPLSWNAPVLNSQSYAHEWMYDGNGRLRRLRWKYYADNTSTTAPWIEWRYTYDAAGQVLSQTRQLDNAATPTYSAESWTYDQNGNVLTATDPDNYTTSATYDERDLPWVVTDGVGTSEQTAKSYEYGADGRMAAIVERLDTARQVRFENEYDGLDRLIRYRIKDAANTSVQAGYVETTYEAGSRIAEIRTYGIGSAGTAMLVDKKTFAYDDFHDCPTRQTSYAYNVQTGAQLRAVVSDFDYGPSGRPMREWTGLALIAKYAYLPCGLPSRVEDAHGNKLETTWDQYGRTLTEVNTFKDSVTGGTALVTTRTFGRDLFGRAITITDSGTGASSQTHAYVFDSCDNIVQHSAPDGGLQVYQFRFDGCMTREDALIAGSTMRARQVQYTPAGRSHVVIDHRNNSVTYVYDGRGRLKQEVYPDGTTSWTNAYNDAGLLTKITAPTGRTVDFAYDWRGMLATATYKNTSGTVVRTDAYQVDMGGFFKRVTKTEGTLTQYVDMVNDSSGRVLTETTNIPGLGTWAVNYQYDAVGRLQTITSPHGYDHQYTYDDRNRVADIHLYCPDEGSFWVANYDYLGTGNNVRRRSTGDGSVMEVSRDGMGRLTGLATNTVGSFEYGYDAGNRVNKEWRTAESKGDAYWYDGLGRLKKATRDSVDPAAELASGGTGTTARAYRRDYYLDGDSHRTQMVTTPMTGAAETINYSTHNQRHHYTSIQTVGQAVVSRAFDLDGRLTTHGSRKYVYDAADNLIRVEDGPTVVGQYGFDALGRRVSKSDANFDYYFVHAGPWMIEDYHRPAGTTANWQLKGAYAHGPGIDNVVMTRHRDWVDYDIDTDKIEAVNLFYHHNRMGSVMALTDPSGSVVEQYRYDEYGKPTVLDAGGNVMAQAKAGNSFLYTGRDYDWETGLYHYRARAYDPSTGSFLQEDPLGMHDGVNVVAYVNANPVNLCDPYGTDGVGEMIDNIMSFINENRGLIAGLIMDLLGPLEGILDLISAATGKDITGWLRGGMSGEPEAMGWWDRACAAASAAVTLAAGAVNLIPKLKKILDKINDIVDRVKEAAAGAGRQVLCKLTGGCFIAGTLVAMGDGTFVPIEDVEIGQLVQCELPAAMPGLSGQEMVRAVTDAGGRVYEGAIITVVVERDGKTARISGTPEHPFWCVSRHQWIPIAELAVGDRLDGKDGDVVVVGSQVDFAHVAVFNSTVDRAHSYRVSELAVLVHNRCFRELLDDFHANPGDWERVAAQAVPSSGVRHKGGVNVETQWRNKRTGETINTHETYNARGEEIHRGTTASPNLPNGGDVRPFARDSGPRD